MPKIWTPQVLLHPNIPQPLHGVNPRTVLGRKWWDKVRQAAYSSTDFHCLACGVHKSKARGFKHLEGHETYDIDYVLGRVVYLKTIPLCHYCHSFIHDGRLQYLLEANKINFLRYTAIMQHGQEVLSREGLTRPSHEERNRQMMVDIAFGKIASWSNWRLIIGTDEYPPLFKSPEEYKKANIRHEEE